ncbi:hypothetical protein [Hydrogenophaga sp. OTU3427]|uniref:hypothetical protein n=1 Tax=Hydrogenophaga sp. OTU3427 TaxID=3043856 RepID=UPI00313E0A45
MNGVITQLNARRGLFIVQIEGGDCAVFELLDSLEVSVGDRVSGNLHALGSEKLLHLRKGQVFHVHGQNGPGSLKACQRLLAT